MAIAFDATSGAAAVVGTTQTFSHTCTGSNRILFVSTYNSGGQVLTGITYSGTAMIFIGRTNYDAGSQYGELWYLIAPATGANNVVVTCSSSVTIQSVSASYTGANQSGQPDASTTSNQGGAGTTSHTTTLTTTATTDCWAVLGSFNNSGVNTAAGTGSTQRNLIAGNSWIGDSNASITPSSTYAMQVTNTSQVAAWNHVMASIAPVAVATSGKNFLAFM